MTKTALMMLAVTSTLVLSGMGRANAATITATYDFAITDFTPQSSPVPWPGVDPWSGSFTITYDPTFTGIAGPFPLGAFSSNLPASYGTFVFTRNSGGVLIGDNCHAGGCSVALGTDLAAFDFGPDASGVADFGMATITSTSSSATNWLAETGTVTLAPTVPLPAALPMFATGLGAFGLLGWRRKRKARAGVA